MADTSRVTPRLLQAPSAAVEALEVHDSIEALGSEWNELADRLGSEPFLRPGWVEAWWRAFGSGKLTVLAVRRGQRLAGVLPLVASQRAVVSPTNWHTPLFGFVAEDGAAARRLADGMLAQPGHRVDLTLLDPAVPGLAECLDAADAARSRVIVRTVARSPYVPTDGDWDQYKREQLGRKFCKDLRRRRRRLEEQGEVTVDFHRGAERLDELLDEGFHIEGSGWKSRLGTAIASSSETRGFYADVARWAADHGWLTLAFVRLDGQALAFDLCLEAGGVSYVLKGGFNPDYQQFAPGKLLTYESVERAFTNGFSSYELLGQDDPYKAVWTKDAHERKRLQAFPRSPAGWVSFMGWTHGRPLARRLRGLFV